LRWRHNTQHSDIQINGTPHNDIQINDIQHNDIQVNDTQHNDILINDTQHNDIQINDTQHNVRELFCWVSFMLCVYCAECHIWALYSDCRYADCHYAECRYVDCNGVIGGATEKVSELIMLIKSVYNKNVCVNDQKHIFENHREIRNIIKSLKL
jgi:hypothetical protein